MHFDASEIAQWADRPNARHDLPELIRRLVLATVPMPSLLRMPSGSSVSLPGWDGQIQVESGNAWVPCGVSFWELSCDKGPKRKAGEDYRKRSAESDAGDTSVAAFVFVTPRRWPGKKSWAKERSSEGRWANVRVLDADDLVAWLQQAPAVASWFARLIGKLPSTGVESLDEWWERWAKASSPAIPPALVTAGRDNQAEELIQWLQSVPSRCYLQADTRDEALAFLGAYAQSGTATASALLTRSLVVKDFEAWRSMEGHSSPLILAPIFSDDRLTPQIAVERGHHVVTPLGSDQEVNGQRVTLPRLGYDKTRAALQGAGLSEAKARTLIRKSARRLPVMRRMLIEDAGGPVPEWASPSTPPSIVALVLVGQWNDGNEADKAIVSEIAGKSYEELEHELASLLTLEDALITRIGKRWRFVSHEEAWHLLAPRLTASDVRRFQQQAIEVFKGVSPEFEMPIEDRFMANIQWKVLPHSSTLREGLARSLAIMVTQSERVRTVDDVSYIPRRVVSAALAEGDDWRLWATLNEILATLAEAAPEAMLDAIERDLKADSNPFLALFAQEPQNSMGAAPHVGLLWALERLAWSNFYFVRVARILARLSEIDPGGQIANRPFNSLRDMFIPIVRFTEASDRDRLSALRNLLSTNPATGWRLLIDFYQSFTRTFQELAPPSWQPWAQDGAQWSTNEEGLEFEEQIRQLLKQTAEPDAEKWRDIVSALGNMPLHLRIWAIEQLSLQTEALKQHPAANNLWAELRRVLHFHRSLSTAAWAMPEESLADLESVYNTLTPSDPALAYAWIFNDFPYSAFPEFSSGETMAEEDLSVTMEQLSDRRNEILKHIYAEHGLPALIRLAELAEEPGCVGRSMAFTLDEHQVIELALRYLNSNEMRLEAMARGALRGLFYKIGWSALEESLLKAKVTACTPQTLAKIYLTAPVGPDAWQRLSSENEEVRIAYWESCRPFRQGWSPEDVDFAADQLLAVHRAADAINCLAYAPISDRIALRLLKALPADKTMHSEPMLRNYLVVKLFEQLDQSDSISDNEIANLEIPLLGLIIHDRPQLALHRVLIGTPSFLADLVAMIYKRSDDQDENPLTEDMIEARFQFAFHVLHGLRLLPGIQADGSVDAESLSTWVSEARRLCRGLGREEMGDYQIGVVLANAPIGDDGAWPCEPVRDLLDTICSHRMGKGFVIGKHNLRGVTSRRVFEGGTLERTLENQFQQDADAITARWPFTAQLLSELADTYTSEARMLDQEAAWGDQFRL